MSKEEKRGVHMIHEDSQLGEVQIADEVVATIAGLAATEVEASRTCPRASRFL